MTPQTTITGADLYQFKIDNPNMSWSQVAEHFNTTRGSARSKARVYYTNNNLPPPGGPATANERQIIGAFDEEPRHNSKQLWDRALAMQARQEKTYEYRANRRVIYDAGPVALVAMGDLHLGGAGVDYRALDADLLVLDELQRRDIEVAVLLMGDLLDNFIVGRLRDMRVNVSPYLVVEEWGLVDYALERLAPFIVGSVAGNHDNWSWALSGIDLLRERHQALTPGILYDQHELAFVLQVGGYECRVIARHDWRGHSMYNPTHGIDSRQHTNGREFDIAIGAHTHRGALARETDLGGAVGDALLCGSYKKVDGYAMQKGFPPPLDRTAVAAVIDEDGILFSTSRLDGLLRVF